MSGPVLVLVRLLAGLVGESRRVVHTIRIDDVTAIPDVLVTLCGQEIRPGTAEQLDGPTGMPCTACVLVTPISTSATVDLPEGGE